MVDSNCSVGLDFAAAAVAAAAWCSGGFVAGFAAGSAGGSAGCRYRLGRTRGTSDRFRGASGLVLTSALEAARLR